MTQALTLLATVLRPLLSSPAIAKSDKKLNQAVKKGNIEAVKSTILAGANVNNKNKRGWTPLHLAAKRGHTEIIKVLIDAGADLSTSNQLKRQALFGKDSEGDASIDLVYRYGHDEARKLLINETANFLINTEAYVDSKYANGWTLLYWAAMDGYVDVARNLIDAGADVNNKNKRGWTPLHLAAKRGHTEIIKVLIDAGADLSTSNQLKRQALFGKDSEGDASIDLVYRYGHDEARKLLINETANFLINTEAYVDSKYANGWTLLYWAAMDGYVDVARNLIDAGADVNNKHEYIETVRESIDIDEYYEDFFFNEEKTAIFTVIETPLSVAYNYGREEMVQFLIDSGADKISINQAITAKATRANLKRKLKEELQRELEMARADHVREQQRKLYEERLAIERDRLELDKERLAIKTERDRLEDRGDTKGNSE